MNICIPVTEDQGTRSPVSTHFGSAPLFMIVDTESGACRPLPNRNLHHAHGACRPLATLSGEGIDGVLVCGIGRGALAQLQASGLRVYLADSATVEEALAALSAGSLREATLDAACAGHGHHLHHGREAPHGRHQDSGSHPGHGSF